MAMGGEEFGAGVRRATQLQVDVVNCFTSSRLLLGSIPKPMIDELTKSPVLRYFRCLRLKLISAGIMVARALSKRNV